MDPLERQLTAIARSISLTQDERGDMREKLHLYMEMKPMRTPAPTRTTRKAAPRFQKYALHTHLRFVPAFLIVAIIFGSSGVSYAAEGALPGDLLYPVKVGVNEEVYSAFLFDEASRIKWLAERAERRLQEASILTAQGKMNDQKSAEVVQHFEEHTAQLARQTQELEKQNPAVAAAASADFASALQAHEAILARLAVDKNGEPENGTRKIVEQVHLAATEATRMGDEAEEKLLAGDNGSSSDTAISNVSITAGTGTAASDTQPLRTGSDARRIAIEHLRSSAKDTAATARASLQNISDQKSDLFLNASAQLDHSDTLVQQGDVALAQNNISDAYNAYKQALALAGKVSRLLDATAVFQIDILPSDPTNAIGFQKTAASGTVVKTSQGTVIREQMAKVTKERAGDLITQVQTLLLSNNVGYPQDAIVSATRALKDAQAFRLRGDIALLTDDLGNAAQLFDQSLSSAQKALDVLQSTDAEQLTPVTKNDNGRGASRPPVPPNLPALDVVTVHHTFDGTHHTYSGTFITPTACFALTSTGTTTAPEKTTLTLTTQETDNSCPSGLTPEPFSTQIAAPAGAILQKVLLNGQPTLFQVVEDASAR